MAATFTRYKDVIIKDFLGAPDDNEITALEETLQTSLPESFKAFLSVANGGNLDGYYVDIQHPEMTVPRSFSLLYGTKPRMPSSKFGVFDHEIGLSREAAQLPNEVLPIARDNSGCELYLDLTDEGEDRVVAFIHGIPDIEDQPEDNAWVTIALSFEDFISNLKADEEYCLEVLADASGKDDEERQHQMIDFLDLALPGWRENDDFKAYKDLQGTSRH